jgi:predicted nuclease of predicted toxin-antitoxin system
LKILIDECLAPTWEEFLREEGFDAIHWLNIGEQGVEDLAILEWAEFNDYVILTRDLDFSNLLAWHGLAKPSLVQLRTGDALFDKGTGALVISILHSAAEPLESGAIITINVDKRRARLRRLFAD